VTADDPDIERVLRAATQALGLNPAQAEAARPIIEAWDEDTRLTADGWLADAWLWQTDFVDWCIGGMPAAIVALCDAVGGEWSGFVSGELRRARGRP
jgi:hypothetical protein